MVKIPYRPKILRRFVALMTGGVTVLAFAPYSQAMIALVSLTLLFYLWTTEKTARECFILGYLFGFGFFGFGLNWVHVSIHLFGNVMLPVALFFTYILVGFLALYPALCGFMAMRVCRKQMLFFLPSFWVLSEMARGYFFGGFPWLNLGTSQVDSLLADFAPLIGDYGLSFILCLCACGLNLISRARQYIGDLILILGIASCIWMLAPQQWTKQTDATIDVALIQGALPQSIKNANAHIIRNYDQYMRLSADHWSADLIIWPETPIPMVYAPEHPLIQQMTQHLQENTILMTGIISENALTQEYFNSILTLTDQQHQLYHKHHLVPFGEYLPLRSILAKLLALLNIPVSDFSSGDKDMKIIHTQKGVFGMSICYESVYSSALYKALPQAHILVNVSNDGWFGDTIAPHQHLQIARMRALENGRYLLRATNSGISAVIDNKGALVARAPQFRPYVLTASVPLFTGTTPFSRFRHYPILIICLFFVGSALLKRWH